MFFVLSKFFFFLTQPVNWIIMLLLYAVFSKKPKWKQRSFYAGVMLLIFFTNHFIYNEAIRLWEKDTITANQITAPYDIGILLGGFTAMDIVPNHDRYNFNERANRFTQTLELYHAGKIKKILITGGSGTILLKQDREASLTGDLLKKWGIPAEDIILEAESRNTRENALFTAEILKKQYPNANCLLITSAFHMRRSEGCFKKAGVAFTPYSVDFLGEKRNIHPEFILIPNSWSLFRWGILTREWAGYIMYGLVGYL